MGCWGVSDPRVIARGEVSGQKARVASRPGSPLRHLGASAAGSKERRPLRVGHRRNVVHHQQFVCASCSENRNQGRLADSLTSSAQGERSSRELHPPCLPLSGGRPDEQGQRDARSCGQLHAFRHSLADAPMCREPRVMPPGRPHDFLPPTSVVGSRRSAGCETLFELLPGELDLPPKRPVRASEAAEGTT